ncbi:hypothetical protein OAD53_05405 [Gammaproteobacteria bacterium]|nr:hypothetical protein [Gammaproteobacteria bacterium]
MDQLLKTLNKLLSLAFTVTILLVILGSIFTQQVRDNVLALVDNLSTSGTYGFVVALVLLYMLRHTPRDINKLIKAKGFNKKYWDSL